MMKKLTIAFLILLFTQNSHSANMKGFYYIVNQDNKVLAKISYRPNPRELSQKNLIAQYSELDLLLNDAEYRGGKIVKHVETSAEKKEKSDRIARSDELSLIEKRALKNAYTQLVSEGVSFNHIRPIDFE